MSGNFCDVFRLVYQRDCESYVNGKKVYGIYVDVWCCTMYCKRRDYREKKFHHIALKFSRWGGEVGTGCRAIADRFIDLKEKKNTSFLHTHTANK